MEQRGFIHDMLDVKVLILFVAAKALYPMDIHKIYELCYQDDCLSYFDVGVAVPQMVQSGHLEEVEPGQYVITEKGKADFKPRLCQSVIKGIASDLYGISCDMLYKSITKYARTDIKSTDFSDAYSLIKEMSAEKRISLCSLEGEYRGENEIKFKISQSQQKKLKQSD